ncbi:MacB-like periplasmic core domain [Vibrio sp. B1FLJ16]|nr:MacB-like periplasmic core domain [Vibrio sp. B1FLJ16]CAE6938097.1 MacB-like periplasmic core domain [Vibrio sp. B1FLJ16]
MLIKLAWRNLWRNKLRTSIMIGAMVFGLMGVVAMIGFMNGLVDSMIKKRDYLANQPFADSSK